MLKRWLAAIAAGAFVLCAAGAFAADEVAVPPLKARVTDLTGTLTASQAQSLETRLRDFEAFKGSQIAVLILPTTQPETIEQYSIRVADAWKAGRAKIDDGVILVVAKNDRKLRIEVGYGLEGAIPDAVAQRVVSDVITPYFRAGDFYGGIAAGTDALMKVIDGESLPAPERHNTQGARAIDPGTVLFLLFVLFAVDSILRFVLGRVFGAAASGVLITGIAWLVLGVAIFAVFAGIAGFVLSLVLGAARGGRGGWGSGGWPSGGLGGGGFGGGGFSGGGGGFGGGGASGSW
jgi:uncharacterized protein